MRGNASGNSLSVDAGRHRKTARSLTTDHLKEHAAFSARRTPATSAIRPQKTIRSPACGVGTNPLFFAAAQVRAATWVVPGSGKRRPARGPEPIECIYHHHNAARELAASPFFCPGQYGAEFGNYKLVLDPV